LLTSFFFCTFAADLKYGIMDLWIKLAAALVPPIALLTYIYCKDPQKEPIRWLLRAVLLGVFIAFPVAWIEGFIQTLLFGAEGQVVTLFGSTIKAFFVAALPEESAKLLVLWLVLRKNPYFDEHFDCIVYAVCVSLGFAAIENVLYVVGSEDWQSVAIGRALLAVPGHYAFAVIMGYCYAIYHFIQPTPKRAVFVLLMPVMAHGVYDALAMSGSVNPLVGGVAFFVLIYFCIKMQKLAQNRIIDLIKKDKV